MSESGWRDMIVGDRMATDREFTDRLSQSEFSRQQWGLIMTAVDFEIESTGDDYQLVADTSKLTHVMPELDRVAQEAAAMGGGGTGGTGRSGGGLVGSVKSMLGLGGGVDDERTAAAAALAEEYATALQSRLEETGKWEQVCRRADQPSPE